MNEHSFGDEGQTEQAKICKDIMAKHGKTYRYIYSFFGNISRYFFFQPMDTDIFYRYDLKKFNVFKQNYEKSEISF